jgi:hypothetical protein
MRKRYVNYLLDLRAHVMRTRQLRERLAYMMRVDNRAKVTYAAATLAVRKVSGARQHPATFADKANALGQLLLGLRAHVMGTSELFARLAGSRDAHKATARTLSFRDAR